jgi:hypothetical protein
MSAFQLVEGPQRVEVVVISALEKIDKPPMLAILEIPKDQRRKEAPIRFRMGLAQELESTINSTLTGAKTRLQVSMAVDGLL